MQNIGVLRHTLIKEVFVDFSFLCIKSLKLNTHVKKIKTVFIDTFFFREKRVSLSENTSNTQTLTLSFCFWNALIYGVEL